MAKSAAADLATIPEVAIAAARVAPNAPIFSPTNRRARGPGGWWIFMEVDVCPPNATSSDLLWMGSVELGCRTQALPMSRISR